MYNRQQSFVDKIVTNTVVKLQFVHKLVIIFKKATQKLSIFYFKIAKCRLEPDFLVLQSQPY